MRCLDHGRTEWDREYRVSLGFQQDNVSVMDCIQVGNYEGVRRVGSTVLPGCCGRGFFHRSSHEFSEDTVSIHVKTETHSQDGSLELGVELTVTTFS